MSDQALIDVVEMYRSRQYCRDWPLWEVTHHAQRYLEDGDAMALRVSGEARRERALTEARRRREEIAGGTVDDWDEEAP